MGDSSSSDSDNDTEYSKEIRKLAQQAKNAVIPERSRKLYKAQYDKFQKWRNEMKISKIDETILMAYFQKMSESYVASTLWSFYTRLRSMLQLKDNVDISKFFELQKFLKQKE